MRTSPRHVISLRRGLQVAGALVLAVTTAAAGQESYGFIRVVEGYADLVQASSSVVEATANYPLLVGDQLRVGQDSRMEAVLPDGTYLRLDGNTELKLGQIALSADSDDDTTLLQLLQGEIQLVLHDDLMGDAALRVDTANATIYLQREGTYRLFTDGASWTEVVVRSGFAEVVTERGSAVVRTGEQTLVDGSRWPRVAVEVAGPLDSLELWGDRLLAEARAAESSRYVPSSLSYSAAGLGRHGHWVDVGGRAAWRPRVATGWRPYHSGWWVYTPSGLTWVSTEPWGWVTYHYGLWDYAPSFGWVWYPGHLYTPAAVYWYWGPTYVGWIPAGYYSRYYGYPYPYLPHHRYGHGHWAGSRFGFHFGVYGWAGGSGAWWSDWTFCSYRDFGHRNSHSRLRTGAELTRQGVFAGGVPRGIIASDTRQLKPGLWGQPGQVMRTLEDSHRRRQLEARETPTELPDLGSWVSRQRELPERVANAIAPPRELSGEPPRAADRAPRRVGRSEVVPERRPSTERPSLEPGRREPSATTRSPVRQPARDWRDGRQIELRTPSARIPSRVPAARPESAAPSAERFPARQWEPRVWQRELRTPPQRGSSPSPLPRGGTVRPPTDRETPVVRRVWEGVRSYRHERQGLVPRGSQPRPSPDVSRDSGRGIRRPSAVTSPRPSPSRPAPPSRSVSPRSPSRAQPSRPPSSSGSGSSRPKASSSRRPPQ